LASAEEENSGDGGIRSIIPKLPLINFAIVGEPTLMHLAIAEKGLLVLDCYAHGEAGHAAHGLGDNSIYKAIEAITWFKDYKFPKVSDTLGDIKMTVTQIDSGNQHNVIPASCHFVVDIRVTDKYSNKEILEIVKKHVDIEVKERSLNLNSSAIAKDHPIVIAGIKLGREVYGSPTLSDQSNLSCPSLKLGPGDSYRSHTADEFIYVEEINEGIDIYVEMINEIML
jgi:acetylornithine deacetylase